MPLRLWTVHLWASEKVSSIALADQTWSEMLRTLARARTRRWALSGWTPTSTEWQELGNAGASSLLHLLQPPKLHVTIGGALSTHQTLHVSRSACNCAAWGSCAHAVNGSALFGLKPSSFGAQLCHILASPNEYSVGFHWDCEEFLSYPCLRLHLRQRDVDQELLRTRHS